MKCTVSLHKCADYNRQQLIAVFEAILARLQIPPSLSGKTVLLKPNLIAAKPSLACTHPEFICAIAMVFLDHGATVLIGDSPAFGSSTSVSKKIGLDKVLKNLPIKIVDFTKAIPRRLACGVTVPISRHALECELLVGLPKVKAHNQLLVSLAVKNLFGVVRGVNKALLHMTQGSSHQAFSKILLDIHDLLPERMHLADGILAMHHSGPLDGVPLNFSCVGGSRSAVALDTALMNALELDLMHSPIQREAMQRQEECSSLQDIVYPDLKPSDFYVSNFKAPSELNPIRFQFWRFFCGIGRRIRMRMRSC